MLKSFSTFQGFRARCVVERSNDGLFTVEFPSAPSSVSLIQILRVLGLETNAEISKHFHSRLIQNDVILNLEVEESKNKEDATELLSKRLSPGQPLEFRLNRMESLLDNYLLPHVGVKKELRMEK